MSATDRNSLGLGSQCAAAPQDVRGELFELLDDLAYYFDDRMDADDGTPNEAMRFYQRLREVRKRL